MIENKAYRPFINGVLKIRQFNSEKSRLEIAVQKKQKDAKNIKIGPNSAKFSPEELNNNQDSYVSVVWSYKLFRAQPVDEQKPEHRLQLATKLSLMANKLYPSLVNANRDAGQCIDLFKKLISLYPDLNDPKMDALAKQLLGNAYSSLAAIYLKKEHFNPQLSRLAKEAALKLNSFRVLAA